MTRRPPARTLPAAAALLLLAASAAGQELAAELARDDECLAGQRSCGLNALQVRAPSPSPRQAPAAEPPAGADLAPAPSFLEDSARFPPSPPDGLLARSCNNGRYCIWNYLITSGRKDAIGIESINAHNVGYYDGLMSAARGVCGGPQCVIMVNPMHHRTQSRFHIHARRYSKRGGPLKQRLERRLCRGSRHWVRGGLPCNGQAQFFSGFPPVFSEAMKTGNIAHAAVTAFPSSCGGRGSIILLSYHCSIEHSISPR